MANIINKIDLSIEITNGRVTLRNKTYNELNEREKLVMNGLLKKSKKTSHESAGI